MNDDLQLAADRLASDSRVMAVYGFGSCARGTAGPRSDVDVAVLLDRRIGLKEELRLRSQIVEELRRDDIDFVVLNHAPPLLRYEVVAAGQRLFARDSQAADRFEEQAAMECFDTAYLRATQQRILREASR